MNPELAIGIAKTVIDNLDEKPVMAQEHYGFEPPWRCNSLSGYGRLQPIVGTQALVWTRRPVAEGSVGVVKAVGFDVSDDSAISGADFLWMEITETPGVVGNGRELFYEFNRRGIGATGLGLSLTMTHPIPFNNLYIWPGQTAQLNYVCGGVVDGYVAGQLWCYEISQDYIKKEYQR